MLALSTKEKQMKFGAILDAYAESFTSAVVDGYKDYLEDVKLPCIPAYFFNGEQAFVDNFIESFSILRSSYMERHFPEFDWYHATDDERELMDERISEQYIFEEEELMSDIETVLQHHQLFYVYFDEAYGENGIEIIVHHFNSPLQEVW